MKEKIIQEIYSSIINTELSKEEKEHLDSYIQDLISKYSFFIDLNEEALKDKEVVENIKKNIINVLTGE